MASSLESTLVAKGVSVDVARQCAKLFSTYEEAKPYLTLPGQQVNYKEYYSLKYHRYYYNCSETGANGWDLPPQVQLSEWLLDAGLTGQDLRACRQQLSAVLWAVASNAHKGEALWSALGLLARLTGNIVGCGNTLDKYRTVRKSNPRIRGALAVLGGGGEAALAAAGFEPGPDDTLVFPAPPPDPAAAAQHLRPLTAVNARLQQLIARKGFTGTAREHDDTGSTPASKYAGMPGFRYQTVIHECSACSRPINDGTDRLVTRRHDCPRGEFRYACEAPGCEGYSLCEECWDRFQAGSLAHPREHAFRAHHPKAAAHNLHSAESASNPWGVALGGGSAARARERLKARTGL